MDKNYLISMTIVKDMLRNGIITDTEFNEINEEMIKEYNPVLSIFVSN